MREPTCGAGLAAVVGISEVQGRTFASVIGKAGEPDMKTRFAGRRGRRGRSRSPALTRREIRRLRKPVHRGPPPKHRFPTCRDAISHATCLNGHSPSLPLTANHATDTTRSWAFTPSSTCAPDRQKGSRRHGSHKKTPNLVPQSASLASAGMRLRHGLSLVRHYLKRFRQQFARPSLETPKKAGKCLSKLNNIYRLTIRIGQHVY